MKKVWQLLAITVFLAMICVPGANVLRQYALHPDAGQGRFPLPARHDFFWGQLAEDAAAWRDWLVPPGLPGTPRAYSPAQPDERTMREVVQDFLASGVNAVPCIPGGVFLNKKGSVVQGRDILPLGSVASRLNVTCNEQGFWATFPSDRYGYNNPDSVWDAAKPRLVFLGDSFALGSCNLPGKGFVDLVRNKYPDVINLSMGMSGPLLMLARLKEYLPPLRPDIVVYAYYEGNDFNDLVHEKTDDRLRKYLTPGYAQGVAAAQDAIDHFLLQFLATVQSEAPPEPAAAVKKDLGNGDFLLRTYADLKKRFSYILFPDAAERSQLEPCSNKSGVYSQENLDLFKRILKEANETAKSWGGTFVFLFIPEYQRYEYPSSTRECYGAKQEIDAIVRELHIPEIDLTRYIGYANMYSSDEVWWSPTSHFDAQGHEIVAGIIRGQLEKQFPGQLSGPATPPANAAP